MKTNLSQTKGERILTKLRDEMLNEILVFRKSVLGDGEYSSTRLVMLKTAVDMLVAQDLYLSVFEETYL